MIKATRKETRPGWVSFELEYIKDPVDYKPVTKEELIKVLKEKIDKKKDA